MEIIVMRKIELINKLKKGFTLAEALVTIGIIGAVAAIGVPVLMQGASDAETVARVKKSYEVLSQGYYSVAAENKGLPMYMWSGDICSGIFADMKGSNANGVFTTSDGINYNCAEANNGVTITVDTNGNKSPNAGGQDVFVFLSNGLSLEPQGNNATAFATCQTTVGTICTGWVIKHGNLKYLECPNDLEWDGNYNCQ